MRPRAPSTMAKSISAARCTASSVPVFRSSPSPRCFGHGDDRIGTGKAPVPSIERYFPEMRVRPLASLGNDDLQILAGHDHGAVVGFVHACDEGVQVVLQTRLIGLVEGCERLEHGA